MTKFKNEIRIDVVMAIARGASIKGTARDYGIERNLVRAWYRAYLSGGIAQVVGTKQHYTRGFKIKAVEYRWQQGLSYSQAAAALGIPGNSTLYTWEKKYLKVGADGLQDTRKGRLSLMTTSKKAQKSDDPRSREQELEAENARLRMENDYLKKLNALVAEREKSKKRTK